MKATLFLALASIAGGQNLTWITQFGTSESDGVEAATSDGTSGVYLGGSTRGSLGGAHLGGMDAWFARYDGASNRIWARQLGSGSDDYCTAMATDGSGGCFVGGFTNGNLAVPNLGGGDSWIARYDSAGNLIWLQQFGTNSADILNDMTPDGLGGVFVGGSTFGGFGGVNAGWMDAWIGHIDSTGNITWVIQLGTSSWESCYGIVMDGTSGVFACGYSGNALGGPHAGSDDAWIARFTLTGSQSWIRQLGSLGADFASTAASDGSGGVFVGGATRGNLAGQNAGDFDGWIAHYDSVGNPSWTTQFGTAAIDTINALVPDGAGGVFSGGRTEGSLGAPSAGLSDGWLARFAPSGTQLWISQFGTASSDSTGSLVARSPSGLFVVGGSDGAFGGPNAGRSDAWIALYDGGLGSQYCTPAFPNSTGRASEIVALGTSAVLANDFTLAARNLPVSSFAYFLNSRTQGFVANPGGSQGHVCLGGAVGRYLGPGQILNSGPAGWIALRLDLTQTPTPSGLVPIIGGQTWNFQAWHRDANPTSTSNFTDAVSVTFS